MVEMNERDRAATERRLKDAAVLIWSKKGFDGASVKTVSEAAGVNVSLINRYFGGKDGLLLTLVKDTIERKQEGRLPYPAQDSLRAEVLHYLRFRYEADRADEGLIRVIISKIIVDQSFREAALESLTYAADQNFMGRLKALQTSGKIRETADLEMLFRQVGFISFSAIFTEGIILEKSAEDTDLALQTAANMIQQAFGT
ncbi:MAG: TetR family transcriptional regulator [Pseudomonadota bacterium]